MAEVQERVDGARVATSVVIAVVLAFAPTLLGVFTMAKLATLLVGVAVLGGIALGTILRRGTVAVPTGWVPVAVALHVVGLLVATLTSDAPGLSLVGSHGRAAGAVTHLAAVVLGFAVVRSREVPGLVQWLAGGVGLVGAVACLQALGVDPTGTADGLRRTAVAVAGDPDVVGRVVGATLGNPNQVGAVLAIGLPLAVVAAVRASGPARAAWAVGVLLLVGGIVAAAADQGPVAAAAGLAVLAVTVARGREGRSRIAVPSVVAVAGALGAVAVVAGATGAGPLSGLRGQESLQLRYVYWDVGAELLADRPLVGVGPDRYQEWFRAARDPDDAGAERLEKQPDAAHDVALHLGATGGLLTVVPWLAVTVGVGARIVARWRRPGGGDDHWWFGALAGGWVAYQVQGLVSIDTPALLSLQWWLAGGVFALSGGLPRRRFSVPRAPRIGTVVGSLLVVMVLVVVSVPLRADLAAGRAARSADPLAAVEDWGRATDLHPLEPEYPFRLAVARARVSQDLSEPYGDLQEAHRRDPRRFDVLVSLARTARLLGRDAEAADWYRHALVVEPHHPDLQAEAAER